MKIAHHNIKVWANGCCWVYFHGRIFFGMSLLGAAMALAENVDIFDVFKS
jgi:hypothetical protein